MRLVRRREPVSAGANGDHRAGERTTRTRAGRGWNQLPDRGRARPHISTGPVVTPAGRRATGDDRPPLVRARLRRNGRGAGVQVRLAGRARSAGRPDRLTLRRRDYGRLPRGRLPDPRRPGAADRAARRGVDRRRPATRDDPEPELSRGWTAVPQ